MALQEKKIMPPPWLAHREIERYSIGWRMGYGEDYIYRFGDWLDTLSPDERTEYRTLFPEPVTWKGWWDEEDSSEVLEHGDFWVNAWQPEGSPKYTRQWLQQEFSMGRKRELCLFWGHQPAEDGQLTKSCLSQWWMEDFWSVANTYLCMEQYMMAGKAELFGDQEIREQILKCSDPKQIKALGRKVRGFDQKVWDKFKYAIVLNGNWCKFSQNRNLREFLFQLVRVFYGNFNAGVFFKLFTHFSEAVVAFVAVNPDNQLTFFNLREGRGGKHHRGQCRQREDASASFDFHIPVLFGVVLVDTLRWLNDDEFPFLTTPFHPPQVYAPPAGCVISIAKRPYCVLEHRKKRPILSPPSRNHAPPAIPRGESQSLILPSPPP